MSLSTKTEVIRMANIYSVAQVNSYIKNMFAQDFLLNSVSVKGEVSNCKYHTSNHIYFTLKDDRGTLSCIMFAGNRGGLSFQLREGQQVVVHGAVDIYERDGKYQLYAKTITLDGTGLLYERFEQLKAKMQEMGMFAVEYKQPIPRFGKAIGIVTAPTGAAVQDIINIAKRRNPYVQLILYPAIVQGDQAAESIIKGIHILEAAKVDVIIIGRGGGSIEDLWAFNEESVANAIFNCKVPIISAIGHETDFTIADFVSDLRAPTPSAAAELAVYDVNYMIDKLHNFKNLLRRSMDQKISKYRYFLENSKVKLQYLSPRNQIREKRTFALRLEESLQEEMRRILIQKRHLLDIYIEKYKGLSPLNKLQQGFSFVSSKDGKAITDIERVTIGERIDIQVKNGLIQADVVMKEYIRRK